MICNKRKAYKSETKFQNIFFAFSLVTSRDGILSLCKWMVNGGRLKWNGYALIGLCIPFWFPLFQIAYRRFNLHLLSQPNSTSTGVCNFILTQLERWPPKKMEDYLKIKWKKWKMTSKKMKMEDDLNFKADLLSWFNNKNLKNKWFWHHRDWPSCWPCHQ